MGTLSAVGSREHRVGLGRTGEERGREGSLGERRGEQTHLSSSYHPSSSRAQEQPGYQRIKVLCHTCSLLAFSGIQAGKLCARKEEILEYFKT